MNRFVMLPFLRHRAGLSNIALMVSGALGLGAVVVLTKMVGNYANSVGASSAKASNEEVARLAAEMIHRKFIKDEWFIANSKPISSSTIPLIQSSSAAEADSTPYVPTHLITGKMSGNDCTELNPYLLLSTSPDSNSGYCNKGTNSTSTFLTLKPDSSLIAALESSSDISISTAGKQYAVIGIPAAAPAKSYLESQGKSLFSATQSYPLNTLNPALVRFDSFTFESSSSTSPSGIVVTINNQVRALVPLASKLSASLTLNGAHSDLSFGGCQASITVAWTSVNATSCTLTSSAGPTWTGTSNAGFTEVATSNVTYTLDCKDSSGGSAKDSLNVSLEKQMTSDGHLIFRTSKLYNGNLGGLSGADSECTALAHGAGLRLDRSWKAVMSSSSQDAKTRISITGKVYNLDKCGTLIANDKAHFWGTETWLGKAFCDENQNCSWTDDKTCRNIVSPALTGHNGYHTMTGSNPDGTKVGTNPNSFCLDWTSASNTHNLIAGDANDQRSRNRMNDNQSHQCNRKGLRLYCISQ